ncbi:MAG TPA: AgmX/PglI C-terminal domain-containing protein [Anaeromyxobacteraceae bacterium]|nr:AgmX/PglI C-terminal domain-containing protein [Anaeromyxobacteraceae bacterium]
MAPRPLPRLAVPLLLALLAACSSPPPAQPPRARAAPQAGAAAPGSTAPDAAPRAEACRDPGAGPEPDAAALRTFVRRRSSQLRDCYQRALKRDAAVAGKATFRFTIGTCGELSDVEVAARRGKVDDAAACVRTAMRGWRTPFRPSEPVTVEYPVAFSASM